ncbi:MAG: thioredoxin reductase [Eubacteriales bacterium]|nr:thioredoxin reductase [Eubacteriales bacterium]MDN5363848.1 thioredoxin reductase [Eubacteriales bacterium]
MILSPATARVFSLLWQERRLAGYISKAELRRAIEETFGTEVKPGERKQVEADLIILGAGPAGLSAAIYAGRAKLNAVVVEEGLPGGQAATTYHIANYPGTPGVIRGRELMDNMLRQAQSFGVRVDDYKEVAEVDLVGEVKKVVTEDTDYYALALIIATGAKPRLLPAEGEDTFRGRGVHYCATC